MKDDFKKHFESEPDTDIEPDEIDKKTKREPICNHVSLIHNSTSIEFDSIDLSTYDLKSEVLNLYFILTDEEYSNFVKKEFKKHFLKNMEVNK